MTILELLSRDESIHLSEIVETTRAEPRGIKRSIRALRMNGEPIVSGNAGYKLAKNASELESFINSRQKEIKAEKRLLQALKKTAARMKEE